jgi:pyridoxal phosphate enzyme (YggS family)
MVPGSDLADRLAYLRRHLPPTTSLLAVSKGQPAERIREAVGLGQVSFGESRLQEAMTKQDELGDLEPLDWHFIGRLQANKVRGVVRRFSTIHSIDSLKLAERVARIAAEEGLSTGVLLQVKLRPDPGKTGFEPDDLRACWPRLQGMKPLRPLGLMTISPAGLGREDRCRLFADCAALASDLGLEQLSMGMSGDWREAVEAGSTWIRVGSGLFGPRPMAPETPPRITD